MSGGQDVRVIGRGSLVLAHPWPAELYRHGDGELVGLIDVDPAIRDGL
jgi:hypothetical protein